jgi:hypothetical protein
MSVKCKIRDLTKLYFISFAVVYWLDVFIKCLRKAIATNPIESRKECLLWMMQRAGDKNSNNDCFQFLATG